MRVSHKSGSYIILLTQTKWNVLIGHHNLADNMRELSLHMQCAFSYEYLHVMISEGLLAADPPSSTGI